MFDLDGTLIDTMNGFADVAAALMAEHQGIPQAEGRRRYLETSGIPFRQQLEVICPGHPANQRVSDTFEMQKRVYADSADMDARTVAGLARLRQAGIKIVVSSNGAQHFVDEFAARHALKFDLVLGFSEGFGKGKPHVDRTCATLGVVPGDILFCGDSLKDGDLAAETGLAFVGRLGTFSRDDFRTWNQASVVVEDAHALAELIVAQQAA
jgi:phosphoglycolate phosphatase-like HAD superfamily hydrolase